MHPRKRFLLILLLTLGAFGAAVGFTIGRVHKWHEQGWTGLYYTPSFPSTPKQQPVGTAPGEVVMTYANGPADGKILFGDIVKQINGVPITDQPRLRKVEEGLEKHDTVTYGIERKGRPMTIAVQLDTPLRSPYVVVKTLVSLLVAVVFVAVALLVYIRRSDDGRAAVFFAFALVSAMAILGSAAALFERSGGRGIVSSFGFNTAMPMFFLLFSMAYAPLILHLSLIFPRPRPIVERHPHLIRWIYAGALLAAVVCTGISLMFMQMLGDSDGKSAAYQFGNQLSQAATVFMYGGIAVALQVIWAGRKQGMKRAFATRPFRATFAIVGVFMSTMTLVGRMGLEKIAVLAGMGTVFLPIALLAAYPVAACVALVRSYRAAGVEEKRQVQWPLWGLLITVGLKIVALAFTTTFAVALSVMHLSMIDWRGLFQALDIIPTVVSLLIPISFAAAILKYRLMNIDLIIRKTVVYAILSTLIVVIYLGVVGGLGTLLVAAAGVQNQTLVIASTLLVALMFIPMRNKLQTLVDRNLFRHRYDYPEALRAITNETRMASDTADYLASVAEKLQQALQSRAVMIFVERQEEYVASAKVGVSDTLLGRLRVPKSFAALLDRPFDPRRRTLPDAAGAALARLETVLVVPAGTRAFIAVAPKLAGGELDVEDIDFLRSAGDQIAMAIDRIRMQVEEADFAQARAIQQTLLPREMPRFERLDVSGIWQPARTMGGDYYDLFKLSENELAVCIGDVAGKGMPAALTMSGLQAAVRASASNSPRDLCERVRRVVVSSLSGGRFVTFFYATIDTEAMKLRWCNAGHNAPVVARADGSIVRLAEGGPAISRLFRDPYSEREVELFPGDRIVLFTDGVSEATDGAGEMFGEERIEELVADSRDLSARELQQTIVDASMGFTGGEAEDDVTLVVVRVAGGNELKIES